MMRRPGTNRISAIGRERRKKIQGFCAAGIAAAGILSAIALAPALSLPSSLSAGPPSAYSEKRSLDLSGEWRFRRSGGEGWTSATVPGCVHTDLLEAGLIPDPYFGCNEDSVQWIESEDWEYEKIFFLPDSMAGFSDYEILFEGLDTYASVYLNGHHLIDADNMFREWRSRCVGLLLPGENRLRVQFRSPVVEEEALASLLPYELPGGSRVFTRKAQYQYGWDWGPRLVTSGIWRPVSLLGWSGARISDVRLGLEEYVQAGTTKEDGAQPGLPGRGGKPACGPAGGEARFVASIWIEMGEGAARGAAGARDLQIRITADDEEFFFDPPAGGGRREVECRFTIADAELWWPNGMGAQRLYDVEVALVADSVVLDSRSIRTGVRTVELVTGPDAWGESFYFRVNGLPVFMKGANYIPPESFPSSVTEEKQEYLVRSAAEAGMNMLRVWGGGIYENDHFYQLCDRYGIMVWQDFIFACALYPWDEAFLSNVGIEAEYNVRRLSSHPCVALWCGNNENDEAWHNWGWQDGFGEEEKRDIWKGYEELFHSLLPAVVEREGAGVDYHPSSPKFGRGDVRSLTEGDCHYWGVWHDAEPFEVLLEKTGRFMSEFGFQSFPEAATIDAFTPPGERSIDSPAVRCHQKHPRGNSLILEYMKRDYCVPSGLEEFAYVSQLLQARGISAGIEAQRRASPFCMGSLYWQLNDCWPVASWSSIDWFGRRKALYYAAARAFEPILVSPVIVEDTLKVYVINDSAEDISGELVIELMDFEGHVVRSWPVPVDVKRRYLEPQSDSKQGLVADGNAERTPQGGAGPGIFFEMAVGEILKGDSPGKVFLSCQFLWKEKAGSCLSGGGDAAPASFASLFFSSPRDLVLPDPEIDAAVIACDEGYAVSLTASRLAKDVFLSFEKISGYFSDNFFDILPGEQRRVVYYCDRKMGGSAVFGREEMHDVTGRLRIMSLERINRYHKNVKQ